MVSLSYVSAYIASSGCNPEANFFSLMALRALGVNYASAFLMISFSYSGIISSTSSIVSFSPVPLTK